ncbi:ParB/RepB/Spo0J family partition protein [Parasphingopyxis algicola]|uniref:ParB/RepB/Spo0J family partition protein n=1 Tax=Parasphingopyxis algicola TaxID=2026624 RepID=UPI0015A03D1C|nr:ParB/RepB/Spo0J family partition protein [Parasphingopyxis algicola]QLC24908.1 ParB/RepB/Spo0J family partition protein [Parasphingopyxis algicola]
MQLNHIPLDHLKVSPLNMRHSRKKPDVSDILPSIRQRGIIQPLLVKPNGKPDRYDIYAGRRRFFAMKAIAREGDSNPVLPCLILDKNDDADAVEASILENTARLEPDEMEQYEAFKRLADKGRGVAEIADTFGVTELMVKRRLALANLLPALRKAYAKEEIDGRTITALTMASKSQQEEWWALFRSADDHAPRGHQLKAWLCGGAHITADKAIFPIDDYPGEILADLFGEEGAFADADLFWEHQNAAIAALVQGYTDKGWSDCVVLDRGAYFDRWNHAKTPKKDGGKVFIEVRHTGEVMVHEGYLTEQEARRREKAANDEAARKPAKPEMTGPMIDYIDLHRHAAARTTLLGHPGVALRLAASHMIAGSRLWRVEAEPQATRKEATRESIAASKAQAAFAKERTEIAALLDMDVETDTIVRNNGDDWRLAAIFARLLGHDDDTVLRILTFVMAETLEAGTATVEALGAAIPIDMAGYWTPDEAFFALLRDKQIVNAMLGEIAGRQVADANVSTTAKVQKGIIRDVLAGEGDRTANPDWRPRWVLFPPDCYRDEAGCAPVANHRRIADLFAEATK